MSGSSALAYLVPALVWAIIARSGWRFLFGHRPQSRFFRLFPILATLVLLTYVGMVVMTLVPEDLHRQPSAVLILFFTLHNLVQIWMVAVARHVVLYLPLHEEPPRRRWLLRNYGAAAAVSVLAVFPTFIPGDSVDQSLSRFFVIRNVYVAVMLALVLWQLAGFARRGMWRPGGLGEPRTTDVVLLACGVVGAVGWILLALTLDFRSPPKSWVKLYDTVVALILAAPLAVRVLGEVVRGFLFVAIMACATAAIYFGASAAAASLADPRLRPLLDLVAIAALLIVLLPGQAWVSAMIDRLVFRRSRRRREELRAFLQTLEPELGTLECCRRALAELARVMHLRGVAVLLADGSSAAHGDFALERLDRVWPRGVAADNLPAAGLADYTMREMPTELKEALAGTEVVAVVPVRSPRRRWGHLFMTTGFLAAGFNDEDVVTVESFAAQLALVLDGAELLARAVAVERSLAHSEKLAAIGELAARIAHEIRNPVTAARSLAQQLAREPDSPFGAEHALILAELERVERQVAALLRFARREELRIEPIDLGALVGATVGEFRPRLEAAGIRLELSLGKGVIARADREKIRQVLINLLENAVDALSGVAGDRRLAVSVGNGRATATIRLVDSGPGVPAEVLPRLFEPFLTLKENGTGLGLAIVRRTVEAHGGRVGAVSPPGQGFEVDVELPLDGRGDA